MPYCLECGVELQTGQKYCQHCGTKIDSPPPPPPSAPPPPPPPRNLQSMEAPEKFGMSEIEQPENCLNCGRKIKTGGSPTLGAIGKVLDSIALPFVSDDTLGNDPRSEAHKRMVASNKAGPTVCYCGIPIFSDPNELKTAEDLFWISKVPFNPNLWLDTDKKGFLGRNRNYEEHALRIVNGSQRLDAIVQYKTRADGIIDEAKIKLFVQQDGRDVIKSSYDGKMASISLTNEYGVNYDYSIAPTETSIFGPPKVGRRVSVITNTPTGVKVRRSLGTESQVHYPRD